MKQPVIPFVNSDVRWTPPTPPELHAYREVTIDCETNGLEWMKKDRPVGLAVRTPEDGRSWYLPWGHRGGGNLDEETVRRWVSTELRGKRIRNINLRFDLHMLRAWGVDLRAWDNTFRDVAHSEALIDDHNRDFSLEGIARKRIGSGKLDAGPAEGIADLPAGVIAPYAIRDVELVDGIFEAQQPLIAKDQLEKVHALEDAVIPVVVEMEANGVPLNMPVLELWVEKSKRILEKMQWELYRTAGFNVNPDSPKDMARLFKQNNESFPLTATGKQGSFPAHVVKAAAERSPAIKLAYRIGKLIDLRNKYLVKYLNDQVNGILYPTLHQLLFDDGEHGIKGTISGRFSCVRPNMQQVLNKDKHKKAYSWLLEYGEWDFYIMSLLIAGNGHVFGADAKQIEYRIFADLTESPRLLARYAENPLVDFHGIVQNEMLVKVRPDVNRTETKAVNFLSIFGGKAGAIARTLDIERSAAQELEEQYHRAFPEAKRLIDRATRAADTRGWIKTRWGRRCRFKMVEKEVNDWRTGGKKKIVVADRGHKALNGAVQGTAADYNKATLVDVYNNRRHLELTMRMTVHDAIYTDIANPDRKIEVEDLLNQQRMDSKVPILWECGVGTSWGDAK